jgi:protein TonB
MRPHVVVALLCALSIFSPKARAEEGSEPPVPVRTVSPAYPEELRRAAINGIVTVSCTIDEKGNVVDARVIKASNPAFSSPALEALSHWKFKPAKKAGTAVPIKVSFPIQFKVDQD